MKFPFWVIISVVTSFSTLILRSNPLFAQNKTNVLSRSSEIVTPQSLDADASALLGKWRKGYATNEEESAPCSKGTTRDPMPSEMIFRDRLMRLPTTMNIPYNSLVREGIEVFLTRRRALIPAMLSLGDYYFPTIESILDRYGLPIELKYLVVIESAMDPTAVSPVGASGLWQFMLPTAKAYGLTINSLVDERLDLIRSTDAAARHLRDLYRVYNDWFMAIAAYNCGMGNLNRAVYRSGGRTDFWSVYPYLPRETRSYVPLFIGAFYTMHYHVDHHLCPSDKSLPLSIDTLQLNHSFSTRAVAQAANVSHDLFMLLNPQYKKGSIPGHISPCTVYLPLAAINRLDRSLDSLNNLAQRQFIDQKNPKATPSDSLAQAPETLEEIAAVPSTPSVARNYTIRKGDTLSGIAKKHGITMDQLMKANGIKSTKYALVPGKKLQIPTKEKVQTKKTKSSKKRSKRRRR